MSIFCVLVLAHIDSRFFDFSDHPGLGTFAFRNFRFGTAYGWVQNFKIFDFLMKIFQKNRVRGKKFSKKWIFWFSIWHCVRLIFEKKFFRCGRDVGQLFYPQHDRFLNGIFNLALRAIGKFFRKFLQLLKICEIVAVKKILFLWFFSSIFDVVFDAVGPRSHWLSKFWKFLNFLKIFVNFWF